MFQGEFPERQYSKEITHYENSCIFMASNILKHIFVRGQTRSYKQWGHLESACAFSRDNLPKGQIRSSQVVFR